MRHQERTERLLSRQLELTQAEMQHRARHGLLAFTLYTYPDYQVNWHHRVLCRALNAFERGDIRRLIITTPPRAGKSELVSRRLPAFMLGRNPDLEIISASYGATLAQSMNRDVQRIITSPSYKQLFPETQLFEGIARSTASGKWIRNNEAFEVVGRRGKYACAGVGGAITGKGADKALIDDPTKNWQDAQSETIRNRHWEWFTSTLYTRLSKNAGICITTTRWHQDDVAGRCMAQMDSNPDADQWVVINLPAIKEGPPTELDDRQDGQALWPDRFPLSQLRKIRSNSERVFTSLYQGRPAPEEGDVVKVGWWQRYKRANLPIKFDVLAMSIDLTFKDKEKSDFNVFQIWGKHGANLYLLWQVRERMSFVRQNDTLNRLYEQYRKTPHRGPLRHIWVEDAANGAALISHVRNAIPGVIPVTPLGSKLARAEAASPYIEAGNVHIPDATEAPWVDEFLAEWIAFPNGTYDDQVDATTMAILQMTKTKNVKVTIPQSPKISRWH